MTPNAYFLEKPRLHSQVWLIGYCYPQNIPRTFATAVNELGCRPVDGVIPSQSVSAQRQSRLNHQGHQEPQGGRGWTTARTAHDLLVTLVPLVVEGSPAAQRWTRRPVSRVLCRPGPKPRTRRSFLWTAPRGTVLATYPDRPGLRQPCPPSPRRWRAHGPYSVLLLAGLAMPSLSPGTRWALTPPFHPSHSGERRFAFCGAIPGVAPGGRYPPPCRGGARTFLDPLAGAAIARPSGPGRNLMDGRLWVKFSHSGVIPVSRQRRPGPIHANDWGLAGERRVYRSRTSRSRGFPG